MSIRGKVELEVDVLAVCSFAWLGWRWKLQESLSLVRWVSHCILELLSLVFCFLLFFAISMLKILDTRCFFPSIKVALDCLDDDEEGGDKSARNRCNRNG